MDDTHGHPIRSPPDLADLAWEGEWSVQMCRGFTGITGMNELATAFDQARTAEPRQRAAPHPTSMKHHILAAVREDRILIFLTLLYLLSGVVVAWILDTDRLVYVRLYSDDFMTITLCYMVGFVCLHAFAVMIRPKRNVSLFRQCWERVKENYLDPRRLWGFVIVMLILPQFMGMFGSYKQGISLINPFRWDRTFMRADYWLHGGNHPWELLQPILGYPVITAFINHCYHVWLFLMLGVVIWQAWNPDRLARMRFLVSFMLMWMLLGSVLAATLSSGGPCYYDRLVGEEGPYLPLLAYLDQADEHYRLLSIDVREQLWMSHVTGNVDRIRGITAMPSMHVAAAVLLALAGWSAGRVPGILLTIFAVLIQLGSVHLAWHYAIDGYVSTILVIALWFTVDWALKRYSRLGRELPKPATTL